MILSTAVFLSALGLVSWLLGHYYSYHGVATIGAVLVVGVGAGVMIGGLEVHTGATESVELNETAVLNDSAGGPNETVETTTGIESTTVERQYAPIQTETSFPLGVLITLLGGALTLRAVDGARTGL